MDYRIGAINRFTTGWMAYFRLADSAGPFRDLDGWHRSNGTNETSGSYCAGIDRYSAIINRAVAVLVWVIVGAFALSLVFVY